MRPISAFVAAVAVAALPGAALAGDFVQKKDGSFNPSIRGDSPGQGDFDASNWQVLDADSDVVKYNLIVNNKPMLQSMKSIEVVEIWLEPKDYPGGWRDGMNAMASGDYSGAAERFRALASDARVHPVVRQKSLLNTARCMASWGKTAEADAAYDALFKAFAKSFYTNTVWKERSQMWMDAGQVDKAKAAAETLLKLPGVSDGDKLEAEFLLVTIDYRNASTAGDKGAIQKCLDRFKALAQQTSGRKEQAGVNALARVGMANCMLELGNANEAKGIFEEISATAKEAPVCAAAFNGLGECFYRMNTKEGFAEARRCFLRTSLLYAEGTSGDQIAKALYYAGDCINRLQDMEKWNWAARQELTDCMRRFPSSPWATKARNLLLSVPK